MGSQEQFCLLHFALFYLIVPRDVKLLNVPLMRHSWVGYVGKKAVKSIIALNGKIKVITVCVI